MFLGGHNTGFLFDVALEHEPPLTLVIPRVLARRLVRGKDTHLTHAPARALHTLHLVVVDRVNENPNLHFFVVSCMCLDFLTGTGQVFFFHDINESRTTSAVYQLV